MLDESMKIIYSTSDKAIESIEHILVDDDENIWIAIQFYGLAKFRE